MNLNTCRHYVIIRPSKLFPGRNSVVKEFYLHLRDERCYRLSQRARPNPGPHMNRHEAFANFHTQYYKHDRSLGG